MTTMLANHLTIDVGQRMVNDLRIAIWTTCRSSRSGSTTSSRPATSSSG